MKIFELYKAENQMKEFRQIDDDTDTTMLCRYNPEKGFEAKYETGEWTVSNASAIDLQTLEFEERPYRKSFTLLEALADDKHWYESDEESPKVLCVNEHKDVGYIWHHDLKKENDFTIPLTLDQCLGKWSVHSEKTPKEEIIK